MFTNLAIACQNQNSTHPLHRLLDVPNLRQITMLGDSFYMDSDAGYLIGGTPDLAVCYWDFVAAPTGAPANAYTAALYKSIFDATTGSNSMQTAKLLWDGAAARGIPIKVQWDDHESWNNIDHDKDQAASSWTGKPNQIHTITTQAQTLALWRIAQAGQALVKAAYFKNPPLGAPNGDIPSAMVGTATAADYPVLYWADDFGPNGEVGGTCYREIHTDTISYKSPQGATDNSSKHLHGATQETWILNQLRDAKAKGMPVVWYDTKDYGNTSNTDGPKSYRTRTNALFATIQSENLPLAAIMSGDKHDPHVGIWRVSNGKTFDLTNICACPFGQGVGGSTQFPEMVANHAGIDQCVIGFVTVDAAAREISVGYMDGYSLAPLFTAVVPFGSRLPSRTYTAPKQNFVSRPNAARATPAAPASGAAYTNTSSTRQLVNIIGGSLTDVTWSADGTTYESIGATRQITLGIGGSFKPTYTGSPTLTVVPL